MRQAVKFFGSPRILKSCFNDFVLSSLEYCAPMRMSAESHIGLLDSIVRSAERLCEGERCCLAHRRKVSNLSLLYKIYHRVNNPYS